MPTVRWLGDGAASSSALWPELDGEGWLNHPGRVVIHVASEGRTPLVIETARSLIHFLSSRPRPPRIDVIDRNADPAAWTPAQLVDMRRQHRYRVESPCLRDGALVPELWLDAFLPVTIAAARPDPSCRLASILAAQAELMVAPNGLDLHVMFEAHRLLAPALSVVCGAVEFGLQGPSWWAASDHDVSLEAALATAAGLTAASLPHLRYFSRHELAIWGRDRVCGPVPRLQRYRTAIVRMRAERARRTCEYAGRVLRGDLVRAAANLHRIPDFVRRRWATLRGQPA